MEFSFGDNPNPPKKVGGVGATIFLILFSLPFAGFGIFALVGGVKKLSAGDTKNGFGLCAFGFVFALIGFGLMFAAIWGGKKVRQAEALKQRYTDQLWLVRPDWAAGKIKSTADAQRWVYLVIGLAFGGLGTMFTCAMLPKELANHNYPALLILLFPTIGAAFLIGFVRARLAHQRYGDCYFELAQIPAPLGGTLDGMIQTGTRLQLEHGLHLRLTCLRRYTTNSGKDSHTEEQILWQDEKVYRPQASLPETEPGHTGIPVFFKIPADQPEATPDPGDGIHWRLEAKAKMSGPGFSAVFEIPVFRVAGAVASANDDAVTDPTAALQESVEELRRDENSRITVTDGPEGREFYFPAARNLGMAVFLTIFFIIWTGVIWLMTVKKAPLLFPIVFSLFDIFILFGLINAWFKSSRVTINRDGLRAVTQVAMLRFIRTDDAADVERFTTKVGMTSNNKAYHDLQLITRAGKKVTLASSLASKPEADWLVLEMTKALGR